MYYCMHCNFSSPSLRGYVFHFAIHRNQYNVKFPCAISGCNRFFKNYNSFKCHIFRGHRNIPQPDRQMPWICKYCEYSSNISMTMIVKHLQTHISANITIDCPFPNCHFTFTNRSTFRCHIHRNHALKPLQSENSELMITDSTALGAEVSSSEILIEKSFIDECDDSVSGSFIDTSLYEKNLALFYLRLQSQYFIPTSTIQFIISEFQELQKFGVDYTREELKKKLLGLSFPKNQITDILEIVHQCDLFSFYNSTSLRTNHMRMSYFKENFKYIAPVSIFLGKNKHKFNCYMQYVPIKDSIKNLISYCSINERGSISDGNNSEFSDFYDGKLYKSNNFFQANMDSLKIILYQDSFEIVNPLGSAKKKHKVLGVYFTLGNIDPNMRLDIDTIQLLLMCKETDLRYFGQYKVFSHLIDDIKDIESNGISVNNKGVEKCIKGTVFSVNGDNLGSHGIGGFVENFVAHYFCRFCLITNQEFQDNPLKVGHLRTPSNYDTAYPTAQSGIKFNSILNSLEHYHVCSPGLPPCLAHDLFEGVVSCDLALYIEYFVKIQKVFTYEELNYLIMHFKYQGSDAPNKPAEINSSERLGGKAVQNWCFLRLLPLIIQPTLNKLDEDVWALILNLRDIVDIICAPKVNIKQIAYLKGMVEDYLDRRMSYFPGYKLKPKHHYLLHYADLIVLFGPLILMSTLRFESKHTLFKRSARAAQNFINVCHTLADRHQFRQAYVNSGKRFDIHIDADAGAAYNENMFSVPVQEAVQQFNFNTENASIYNKVRIKGTHYKIGHYVILKQIDDGLIFGKIEIIVIKDQLVVFVVSVKSAKLCAATGSYILNQETEPGVTSIKFDDLLDYYPLSSYPVSHNTYIPLHHAFCDSL